MPMLDQHCARVSSTIEPSANVRKPSANVRETR